MTRLYGEVKFAQIKCSFKGIEIWEEAKIYFLPIEFVQLLYSNYLIVSFKICIIQSRGDTEYIDRDH